MDIEERETTASTSGESHGSGEQSGDLFCNHKVN